MMMETGRIASCQNRRHIQIGVLSPPFAPRKFLLVGVLMIPFPVLVTQRWPDVLCLYCLCCFYWLCWRPFEECECCKYRVVPVPFLDASCDVFLGRIISCKYIVVPLLLCCQKDARRPPGNQNPPSYYSDPPP